MPGNFNMEYMFLAKDHKQCIADEEEIKIHKSVYEANLISL